MVVELELESALALDFAIRISTALGVLTKELGKWRLVSKEGDTAGFTI